MGCNIHGGLEIKDLNGKWHRLAPVIHDLTNFDRICETDIPLGRDSRIMSYVHFWK